MTVRWRPPLFLIAVLLLAAIGVLAALQYRWVGQISEAERDRVRAAAAAGAAQFAQDFDRELTRAYLLFQGDPLAAANDRREVELGLRYDRWQATAQFPRLISDYYVFSHDESGAPRLDRFDPSARVLLPAVWPASLRPLMDTDRHGPQTNTEDTDEGIDRTLVIRRVAPPIWPDVPAIVVPQPALALADLAAGRHSPPRLAYTVLVLDRDYIARELLPALAERHFGSLNALGAEFRAAVVTRGDAPGPIYQSTPEFLPAADEGGDASADLFQVRTADFATLAAEVRRFTAFTTTIGAALPRGGRGGPPIQPERPVSILVQTGTPEPGRSRQTVQSAARWASAAAPAWRLVLKHPAGSLETAVSATRRRNLILSSGILAVLGASMGLLVLSTRRAQRLARQQMEFVAAVSHELRTPLAVIRSAAENLADGVIRDDEQVRKYGDLMRHEGRRLTDMVEQILELAGIDSGARGFALSPVSLDALLRDLVPSLAALPEAGRTAIEIDLPDDLPGVLGDEPALRRAFQNLLTNAIKYGGDARWVGIRGRAAGGNVTITVADRGIGIKAVEQEKIFEPFYRTGEVVAAQIQGAGLGLSLVRRIVESHGGRVTVASTHGKGSEFTVHLRAASAEVRSEAAAGAPVTGVEAPRSL
jgi:signal transduction histidine kinase